ncbi:hypothetical protein SMACR_06669 [Sordaria macrospora]|uniref:WGS project CABT00000000 data, contig 2.13 n=2 Tax=Sordaria macrospora TaxID=5147 RepID=F7VYA1_SORMK|nr:uncharacterized protein SMAC_06669 [Sordaria macrospora k-hell]KAA8632572.1 hypothetical protein SMACR_06669 [Sordaria macrospora]WPJ62935.1 hypothetical protein SMAC4_06669 [Sordaria macrospora]CCC10495.1 unnamed protein product [Sordaria macrospora k-hell]
MNLTTTGTETMSTARPQVAKTLACARCHSQKLRCIRRIADSRTCDRCLSAGIDCVERKPQRMGRPVELGNGPRSQVRHGSQKSARGDGSPARKQARQNLGLHYGMELRETDISITYGFSSTLTPVDSDGSGSSVQQGIPTGVSQLENWSWSINPAQTAQGQEYLSPSRTNGTGVGGLVNDGSLGGEGNLPASNRTADPSDTRFTYEQPMLMSLEDINDMLLNFDDGVDWTLQPSTSFSGQSSSLENGGPDTDSFLDDPIEQLSKLQLELYQCLNVVRAVEKQKREFMEKIAAKACGPIDTTWAERLFAMTEKFISALEGYANSAATNGSNSGGDSMETDTFMLDNATSSGNDDPSTESGQQKDGIEYASSTCDQEVDPATGLMIVSCVTRLLQIFESLVFIVETMRATTCPPDFVHIRLGAFVPNMTKALHARLLGQYVLHLLENISEMAARTVPSRQLYARAVKDNKAVESNIRERLIALIQS